MSCHVCLFYIVLFLFFKGFIHKDNIIKNLNLYLWCMRIFTIRLFVALQLMFVVDRAMGYQNGHWNRTRDCSRARKQGSLIKQQVMLCRRNLELMPVVAHSARESVKVCKELFRDRRWNCSTLELVPNYMADLTGGKDTPISMWH